MVDVPEDTRPSRFRRPNPGDPAPPIADPLPRVDDRIKAFFADHPKGTIRTKILNITGTPLGDARYIVQASIRRLPDGWVAARAHATRSTGDTNPVSAEFPLETAETVAVGRALRLLGYGAGPSLDEFDPTAPEGA